MPTHSLRYNLIARLQCVPWVSPNGRSAKLRPLEGKGYRGGGGKLPPRLELRVAKKKTNLRGGGGEALQTLRSTWVQTCPPQPL